MKLVEPSLAYAEQIQAYRSEFLEAGSTMDGCGWLRRFEDSAAWIEQVRAERDPATVPADFVPCSTFLCIREEDDQLVGMIQIRHCLNEMLRRYAGHIGYSVAPSQRRKGYATRMLALGLEQCRAMGLSRVLVACRPDNEGSRRTILHNGGLYESTVYWPERDVYLERYWITIKKNKEEPEMKELKQAYFTGERALFGEHDLRVVDSVFDAGESPLKECRDLELRGNLFRWKYPLWYCKNVDVEGCTWFEMARAGVWYTDNIRVRNAVIQAPKNFRRCNGLTLEDVVFTNPAETVWSCKNVKMKNVSAAGAPYFCMNSENLEIDGLTLDGNYSFDGAKNIEIRASRLLSKDAFWNSENIAVYDTFISGEYLGWNARKLTLVNCTVESLQGMCYIENLKMINCKLIHTSLAFEYATVEAEIASKIDSVLNPSSGTISAPAIGELILEKDFIDPGKTKIVCKEIDESFEHPEWRRK